MNSKKLAVAVIMAALFAWTGFETYRYWVAKNQLAFSLEQQHRVTTKLAQLKSVQVASKAAPVSKQ